MNYLATLNAGHIGQRLRAQLGAACMQCVRAARVTVEMLRKLNWERAD